VVGDPTRRRVEHPLPHPLSEIIEVDRFEKPKQVRLKLLALGWRQAVGERGLATNGTDC
jgi:hypothetical protein